MKNALKGAALAATNAVVLGVVISLSFKAPLGKCRLGYGCEALDAITFLAMIASIPLGIAIGILAGRLRHHRLAALEIVALGLVPIAGVCILRSLDIGAAGSDFLGLVIIAWGPTAIATLVLERWTRPAPALPRALHLEPCHPESRSRQS